MKTCLLPSEGNLYRANLHSHSTISDGSLTPQALKDLYKSSGYSILAIADHNHLISHEELCDEDFLMLPAVEYDIAENLSLPGCMKKVYHFNFYPEDPHNLAMPCYNSKKVYHGITAPKQAQQYVGDPNYEREYSKVNEVVAAYCENGFIAMLNHPTWSLHTAKDYEFLDLSRFFAMEIYNHGMFQTEGYYEINTHLYDTLLRRGHKLFCTATDDNHNFRLPREDASCGGFVMIKAPELTHRAIINALKAGNFYASMGPEIRELYIENNILHVKTSPAAKIVLSTGYRCMKVAYPTSPHAGLSEASFDLSSIHPGYVRVTVTDERGHMAWSQPYYKTEPAI